MQADVLAEVQALSNAQADSTLASLFYAQWVIDLADALWLTNMQAIAPVAGVLLQAYSALIINLVATIYDNVQMDDLRLRDLESIDSNWRKRSGYPRCITTETESAKSFSWYPRPDVTGPPISANDPTGAGYLPYQALLIYGETRADVLPYLELPLALRIIQQEYARESDHTDRNVAQAAKGLADLMMELVK